MAKNLRMAKNLVNQKVRHLVFQMDYQMYIAGLFTWTSRWYIRWEIARHCAWKSTLNKRKEATKPENILFFGRFIRSTKKNDGGEKESNRIESITGNDYNDHDDDHDHDDSEIDDSLPYRGLRKKKSE